MERKYAPYRPSSTAPQPGPVQNRYKRPPQYEQESSESESESESDSGSSSDSSADTFENIPVNPRALYETPLQLATYNPGSKNNPYSSYENFQTEGATGAIGATGPAGPAGADDTIKTSGQQLGQFPDSKLKTQTINVTSLITVDSRDRDHTVFPQPTDFTLYLPDTYKSIITFQFTQIKLLSAFFYFRNNKYNTWFDVHEEGRTVLGTSNNLINRVQIREGSYDINGLLGELTIQMNTSPIFFYYPNGFADFVPLFSTTGDLAYNFNKPGDYFYNSFTKTYVPKPTLDFIVKRYFPSRLAGLTSYTYEQMLVAYYYPVLNEAFLNPVELAKLNATVPGLTEAQVYDRVIYNYEGLDDPVIYALIQQNISALDTYRTSLTFANHLVNNYIWGLDTKTNKTYVTSCNLNTSIASDIQAELNFALSNTLCNDYGYSQQQYNQLSNQLQADASLINSLYNYYQIGLANYYAVNYGSYSLQQLVSPSTLMYLQNGSNVSSVYNSFTLDYIQARAAGTIQLPPDYNATPSTLISPWSSIITTQSTFDLSTINEGARGVPYEFSASNFLETQPLTDSNAIMYINPKKQAVSILTDIHSTSYAIFRFRSDVRQTVQIETLPKPFFYRYPKYMYAYGKNLPLYYNKSYTFDSPGPVSSPSNVTITGYSTIVYGQTLAQSIAPTGLFSTSWLLQSSNSIDYFEFVAPQPSTPTVDAVGYKYNMYLTLALSTISQFTTPVQIYLYHDLSVFYKDINEGSTMTNAYNFVASTVTNTVSSSWTLEYPVIAGDKYGVIVKADGAGSAFGDMPYHFAAYTSTPVALTVLNDPDIPITAENNPSFLDPLVQIAQNPENINFAKTNDSAWTRLNTQSNLYLRDPSHQGFNQIPAAGGPVIGYDDNNVSSDFTDYKGWTLTSLSNQPATQYRKDPINGYQLISNVPYSTGTQTYFYPGGTNTLQTSNNNQPYSLSFNTVKKREYKIVNWYDDVYMAPHAFDSNYNISSSIDSISTRQLYTKSFMDLGGYSYSTLGIYPGASTLQLGYGVAGFSFLPTNGNWDCDRFAFKSAYTGPASPNNDIAYIGIFDTFSVKNIDRTSVTISDAIAILSSSRQALYSTFTQAAAFNGFDPSLGAYYEYTRLPVSSYPNLYKRHDKAAAGLSGYTQLPCTIVTKEESYYSILPFKADGTLATFFMPTGSVVPFPDNSTGLPSTSWLSSGVPTDAGPREAVVPIPSSVLSNYVANVYSAQYEQSLPINGQIVHYYDDLDIVDQANGMKNYSPWHGLVGDERLELKAANYNEVIGSNSYRYLLYGPQVATFGGPSSNFFGNVSTSRYCEKATAYMVRNEGTSNRDTVYVNEVDFRTIMPAGEQMVQWSATSSSVYLLTVSTAASVLKVYPVVGSLSNTGFTLGGLITSFKPYVSTATYTDYLHISSPQFLVTNSNNFIYTDRGASASTMRGVLVHEMSSGTSLYSGFFVSSSIYFETTANGAETQFHTLLQDPVAGSALVREGDFTVSGAAFDAGVGMNLGQLTLSNLLLPAFYGSNVFSIRSDPDTNCYMFSSNYTDRWVGVVKSPDFSPIGSNLQVLVEAQAPTFFNPINNLSNVSWMIGDDDSYWIKVTQDSYYTQHPWLVYGNARVGEDRGYSINSAWQIFYPTMKVTLTKKANAYNAVTDLTDINYFSNFGNYYSQPPNYPEWPHTNMFFYSNYDSLMSDLSTVSAATTLYKWGQESNYMKSDTEFQGYYFNSYIYNAGVYPSPANLADSNSYYYVAIRAHAPTEDFQTIVRFQLTNRYDFGFISASNLFNEISTIQGAGSTTLSNYNPEYIAATSNFNRYFSTNTLAMNINLTSTIFFTGFSNYHSTMRAINDRYLSTLAIYSSIRATTDQKVEEYLLKYYSNILPPSYFQQTKFFDPIRFQLLFKSSIYPPLAGQDQFWGLGYNLGFPKADMSNNTPATPEGTTPIVGSGTLYNAQSFYKILEDYIYLRLNDEFLLNRMDTTGAEDLAQAQETTGATRQFYAKLLLSPFGTYSQSMIQNPVALNPPIARIDNIRFQWVDATGTIIDNSDCEWSGILQITQSKQVPTADATIIRPANL